MGVMDRLVAAAGYPQNVSADSVGFIFKMLANRCVSQRTKEADVC